MGRLKFPIIYLVSGFAGSVLILVAAPVNALVVGASGAIFGIFGALAVHAYLDRGRDFQSRRLLYNVIFLLVINLVFSFATVVSPGRHTWVGSSWAWRPRCSCCAAGVARDVRPWTSSTSSGCWSIVAALVAITLWRVNTFVI